MKYLSAFFFLLTFASCSKKKTDCSDCKSAVNVQRLTQCRAMVDSIFSERLDHWTQVGHCDSCFDAQEAACNALAGSITSVVCDSLTTNARYSVYASLGEATDVSAHLDSADIALARQKSWDAISGFMDCFQ